MDIRQRFIKKLITKKDEQFSNLIQYCLYTKEENLNNIEKFLRALNEFSQLLGFEALVDMSNELDVCLSLYRNGTKRDKNSLLRILELYSNIYSEIEKLETELLNTKVVEEKKYGVLDHNSDLRPDCILIVDDDTIVLDLLEKILKKRGYDVISCSSPFDVIKIIKENKIDLAILDLILPEIDGCEIAELIRKTEPELPVIILSGSTNTENKIRALKIGADDYITKPFDEKELIARVERALARALNFKITSIEDGLTGAYTKSHFWRKMKEIKCAYKRNKEIFSLAFVDMDDFKDINDTYGHLIGDEALKCFVCTLKSSLRFTDYVFRFGGDEFVILFPETNEKKAYNVLERFRNSINYEKCMKDNIGIAFEGSFSAGITEIEGVDDEVEDIIKRADMALYEAKAQGKNRTCIYEITHQLNEKKEDF